MILEANPGYIVTSVLVTLSVLFLALLIVLFTKRPIETVYDKSGKIAFKIYQIGINGFSVIGFNGYPKRVNFKTYVDVHSFVDKKINGW